MAKTFLQDVVYGKCIMLLGKSARRHVLLIVVVCRVALESGLRRVYKTVLKQSITTMRTANIFQLRMAG